MGVIRLDDTHLVQFVRFHTCHHCLLVMAFKGRKWKFLLLLNVLGLAAIFILLTNTKWLENSLFLPSKAVLPDSRMVEKTTQMETVTEPELETTTMELEITNESVQDSLKERISYLEDIVFNHLGGRTQPILTVLLGHVTNLNITCFNSCPEIVYLHI